MNGIVEIPAERFGAANPYRHPYMFVDAEEREFFSSCDGWYLGVLLWDNTTRDHGWVVSGPGQDGMYRGIGQGWRIANEADAREQLLAALSHFAAGGMQAHPL